MEKVYLGDSVYCEFDGYSIVLTTENGYGATNSISMEPEVMSKLIEFSKKIDDLKREAGIIK